MSKRLVRGVFANGLGQIVVIFTQLVATPVLASTWGAEKFGLWLLFTSLPAYLSMGDFGLATSAGNQMTMLVARDEIAQARRVYHSAWIAVTTCCLIVLALGIVAASLVPATLLPHAGLLPNTQARYTLLALTGYGALCLQNGIQQAAYRSIGLYAKGTTVNAGIMLSETLAILAVVLAHGGLFAAALALLTVRLLGVVLSAFWLYRRAGWLRPGVSHASLNEVKELLHLGLLTMLVPAAYAINLQGALLVVGATLGPAQVAVFAVTRTLTRVGIQASALVNHAVMPEFAIAVARSDKTEARRLYAISLCTYAVMLLGVFAGLALFGPWFIHKWTHGSIEADRSFVVLMALSMVLQGVWHGTSNLLLAINMQRRYAPHFLAVSILLIALEYTLSRACSIQGAALALIAAEALMVVVVNRAGTKMGFGGLMPVLDNVLQASSRSMCAFRDCRIARRHY